MSRRRRGARRSMLVLALAAACRGESGEPVRLGVVVGNDGVRGVEMALADANAAGGLGGRHLTIRVIPHQFATAAEPSILAADSLAADLSVVAVIGHSNSAASLAASQVYNARRLAHVAPTSTAPMLTRAGDYTFRLVPDDRRQAEFMAHDVVASGARRVAVLFVNDDYGRALGNEMRQRLGAGPARIAYQSPFREGASEREIADLRAAVDRVAPELVVWLGRAPELLAFLRLGDSTRRAPVVASDGLDANLTYLRPAEFPGVRFVRFIDPASAPLRAFRDRYRAAFRHDPTSETVLSYDAASLLVSLLRGGARTRDQVRDALAQTGRGRPAFRGLTGEIAFDANGDVARPHLMAAVTAAGVVPASRR